MKTANILLVEDNEGDILLTTEALEDSKILNKIDIVRTGKDALDYVFKKGIYHNVIEPDLILLDINLPYKSGHEVLHIIKEHEAVKHIPIIMLTTSSSERDISLSYKHHANCYITKPVDVINFLDAIATIEHFWLSIVTLPSKKK
ncbi:response regulator [Imtechella halotolerans]|uniref:Response regulator receiver protein n=1 Tax=Imtechella halotolerans K1 TaxID=946077 RepID=I0W7K1_9FLAO|nr:response regulator [Imtechella halotolerans]EID72367.1 response regulator receiver protein [Imtechella halotolerans K1]WMQ64469.1 response regulator [Imtechella halotolerans]